MNKRLQKKKDLKKEKPDWISSYHFSRMRLYTSRHLNLMLSAFLSTVAIALHVRKNPRKKKNINGILAS